MGPCLEIMAKYTFANRIRLIAYTHIRVCNKNYDAGNLNTQRSEGLKDSLALGPLNGSGQVGGTGLAAASS